MNVFFFIAELYLFTFLFVEISISSLSSSSKSFQLPIRPHQGWIVRLLLAVFQCENVFFRPFHVFRVFGDVFPCQGYVVSSAHGFFQSLFPILLVVSCLLCPFDLGKSHRVCDVYVCLMVSDFYLVPSSCPDAISSGWKVVGVSHQQ